MIPSRTIPLKIHCQGDGTPMINPKMAAEATVEALTPTLRMSAAFQPGARSVVQQHCRCSSHGIQSMPRSWRAPPSEGTSPRPPPCPTAF